MGEVDDVVVGEASRTVSHGPLFRAVDVPLDCHPTVHIPSHRRHALSQLALQRAKSGRGDHTDHERGIYGEFAVAKWLDYENPVDALDKTIYQQGGDPGYDLVYRGRTIDVKTVGPRWSSPALLVSAFGDLRAEFYVLAQQLNVSNYRILGYAPRSVVADAPVRSISYPYDQNKVHFIQQQDLFPIAWS